MNLDCDSEGYLLNYQDWSPAFAEQKAQEVGLSLNPFDWQLLAYIRSFYAAHALMPLSRLLVRYVKTELDPGFNSIKLQERYSDKPLRVLAKMAGLPKPIQCI